jgi:DNA-binding Lrp family transcriptional regulator
VQRNILELLRDRSTGTTHRGLAERYGISLSSVKRLLRRHRR